MKRPPKSLRVKNGHTSRYIWVTVVLMAAGLLIFWKLSSEWFLKLAPQILAAMFLIVVGMLDYEVDKDTEHHKLLRRLLFLLIFISLVANLVQTVEADKEIKEREAKRVKEDEDRQRATAMRMLDSVAYDLSWNESKLREKEFVTRSGPAANQLPLETRLLPIRLGHLISGASQTWRRDFVLFTSYGNPGNDAYNRIENMYSTIDKTEKDELAMLPMIERERKKKNIQVDFDGLHEDYVYLQGQSEEVKNAITKLYLDLKNETTK